MGRSVDQLIKGNYSEESTALGTAMEVAAGFTGADIVADIRDITYDVTHWKWTWAHVGGTNLDGVGAIPGIGVVKNLDEVWGLFKKNDRLVTSTKKTLKAACFTEGTIIVTEDGYKKIEDVQVGDMVLAKNIETGEQNYRLVLQRFVRKSSWNNGCWAKNNISGYKSYASKSTVIALTKPQHNATRFVLVSGKLKILGLEEKNIGKMFLRVKFNN